MLHLLEAIANFILGLGILKSTDFTPPKSKPVTGKKETGAGDKSNARAKPEKK